MTNAPTIKDLLNVAEMELLSIGGVDNWDGYEDALEDYEESDDLYEDADDYLRALKNHGVDNWAWYDASRTGLREYEEYLNALDDLNNALDFSGWENKAAAEAPLTEVPEVVAAEAVVIQRTKSEETLHEYIAVKFGVEKADEIFNLAVANGVWKRTTFPSEFANAMEVVRKGVSNPLEVAREEILMEITANGKLDTFLRNL